MRIFRYNSETSTLEIFGHYLSCPFGTWWKARKFFKRPKFKFFFGKRRFWPFASTEILQCRVPKWFPISIWSSDIMWKDKWNTPRMERNGYFCIFFGRNYETALELGFIVEAPKVFLYDCTELAMPDNYWESLLWYLYYSKEYGMKNYKELNLIKARNTMQSHWSKSDSIVIKKYKVLSTRHENIFDTEYFVVSLKSKYLSNLLFWEFGLTQKVKLSISIIKDGKTKVNFSKFLNNLDNKTIDVYIPVENNLHDFVNAFESGYDEIEIARMIDIDLGPTFNDQFLTEYAQKLIRDETNKE